MGPEIGQADVVARAVRWTDGGGPTERVVVEELCRIGNRSELGNRRGPASRVVAGDLVGPAAAGHKLAASGDSTEVIQDDLALDEGFGPADELRRNLGRSGGCCHVISEEGLGTLRRCYPRDPSEQVVVEGGFES